MWIDESEWVFTNQSLSIKQDLFDSVMCSE